MSKRTRYSDEIKRHIVKMVEVRGLSVARASKEADVPEKTVYRWISAHRSTTGSPRSSLPAPHNGSKAAESLPEGQVMISLRELQQLRKEKAEAQEDADILKKAMAYFAKPRA